MVVPLQPDPACLTAAPHFHQHLIARHAGTPEELGWMASHEWPEAPRADGQLLENLCGRLKPYLGL
ncbi:MAG TPA: hypothetical protein VGB74_07580 [Actinoplanes sp.]|jgi:diadenosine tetraphosphate (Ap4A) HIT family hydrolase